MSIEHPDLPAQREPHPPRMRGAESEEGLDPAKLRSQSRRTAPVPGDVYKGYSRFVDNDQLINPPSLPQGRGYGNFFWKPCRESAVGSDGKIMVMRAPKGANKFLPEDILKLYRWLGILPDSGEIVLCSNADKQGVIGLPSGRIMIENLEKQTNENCQSSDESMKLSDSKLCDALKQTFKIALTKKSAWEIYYEGFLTGSGFATPAAIFAGIGLLIRKSIKKKPPLLYLRGGITDFPADDLRIKIAKYVIGAVVLTMLAWGAKALFNSKFFESD